MFWRRKFLTPVWAGWAGDTSHRAARPEDGYQHALTEVAGFDPVAYRFTGTWWEQDQPQQRHTETGWCYTPADFWSLLEGNGLTLAAAFVAGEPIDPAVSRTGHAGLLLTPSCKGGALKSPIRPIDHASVGC